MSGPLIRTPWNPRVWSAADCTAKNNRRLAQYSLLSASLHDFTPLCF